jgi:FkbM family methyltransferase
MVQIQFSQNFNSTMNFIRAVKKLANMIGVDIVRSANSPSKTLLGISTLPLSTIIDVGANKGQFAKAISMFHPSAKLHCVEPLDEPYCKLKEWASTQNGRVICYKTALGLNKDSKSILIHSEHDASSSLLPTTPECSSLFPKTANQQARYVEVSTLDLELYDQIKNESGNILLKLDVQGYEDRVLGGAEKVLAKCKAVITEINIANLYAGQAKFENIVDILAKQGLLYSGNIEQIYDRNGKVVYVDSLFWRHETIN